jgi:small subunit ribosomal protein S17
VSETEDPTTTEATRPAAEAPSPAEAPASAPTTAEASAPAEQRGERKMRTGVVVSEKMDKTVLVAVRQVVRHATYGKTVRRSSKLAAHDEANDAHLGDTVRLMETRPLSKTKRWRVVEVIERAK